MTSFVLQTALIVLIGIGVCVAIYPAPFVFGIAKIVTGLHSRWRRHLVRKYGTQLANGFKQHGAQWLKEQGWTQAEIDNIDGKRHEEVVILLGTKFVHETFGEPSQLDRLMGVAD
jgi:hypothetical protein